MTLDQWFAGIQERAPGGPRPADQHGRVLHVHGRDARRRALDGRAQDPRAQGRRGPDRAAHQQREGVGRATGAPCSRSTSCSRRSSTRATSGMRKPDARDLRAHVRAHRRRARRRRSSSTTTPRTSPRRVRSAWRRCTSARTRSTRVAELDAILERRGVTPHLTARSGTPTCSACRDRSVRRRTSSCPTAAA